MHFNDPNFGNCTILHDKKNLSKNVCLFASYTPLPRLPEYIFYYLSDIKKADFSIVFIIASPLHEKDLDKLSNICEIVIQKENIGTDFGSWCAVLRWLGYGTQFDYLYLCNDSVFGPFIPFSTIHRKFTTVEEDFLGLTDSFQVAYHIQSYFLGFKKNILQSNTWKSFWKNMLYHQEKRKIIDNYEVGLTQHLKNAGFECFIWTNWSKKIQFQHILDKVSKSPILREKWINRVLFDRENVILDINPSSFLWMELISECGHPFIKRELFLLHNLFEECEIQTIWENFLHTNTTYPTHLLKDAIFQIKFFKAASHNDTEIGIFQSEDPQPLPNKVNCKLFESLERILPKATSSMVLKNSASWSVKNFGLNVPTFDLYIEHKRKNKVTKLKLVFLDQTIMNYSAQELSEIKNIIKDESSFLPITPDIACKSIVTSLFAFKNDHVLHVDEFLATNEEHILVERIRKATSTHSIATFQRITFQAVAFDMLNNSTQSGFLLTEENKTENSIEETINHQHDYQTFLEIRNKYILLYENTPYWYKIIGQLIKLLSGKKKILIQIKDKHVKEKYDTTSEDIRDWYFHQYEVLPEWYKKVGATVRRKEKIL